MLKQTFEEGNLIYLEEQFCNEHYRHCDTNKNYYLSVYYALLMLNPITTHVEVEDLMTDTNVEVMRMHLLFK